VISQGRDVPRIPIKQEKGFEVRMRRIMVNKKKEIKDSRVKGGEKGCIVPLEGDLLGRKKPISTQGGPT